MFKHYKRSLTPRQKGVLLMHKSVVGHVKGVAGFAKSSVLRGTAKINRSFVGKAARGIAAAGKLAETGQNRDAKAVLYKGFTASSRLNSRGSAVKARADKTWQKASSELEQGRKLALPKADVSQIRSVENTQDSLGL